MGGMVKVGAKLHEVGLLAETVGEAGGWKPRGRGSRGQEQRARAEVAGRRVTAGAVQHGAIVEAGHDPSLSL